MRDAGVVRLLFIFAAALVATTVSLAQEALPAKPVRTNVPGPNEIRVTGLQEKEGSKYHGRGGVTLETAEMQLTADEMDYDEETGNSEARGHVKYIHFARNETLEAERVEYNLNEETGTFYQVKGQVAAKIEARPGVLTTSNPYSFTCAWAEREKDRYICHSGTATNCKLPNPWWVLRGPKFDIIPEDRAISRNSLFWLKGVPIFYTPYFYKSLKRAPRKSGLLTPNIGNSSRRGKMLGAGYYWAINRSYDAMYRWQWFTQRGFAHHVDFRGKPTRSSDFNFILYGVNDTKGRPDNPAIKEGGYLMSLEGRADLKKGFKARAEFNYLSSFRFRQAFTESFYEAIYSQVNSVAYVTKQWSTFSFDGVYESNEYFPTNLDTNRISIRKLPSVEFRSRDREISRRILPLWVSWETSFAMLRRNQLLFQTRRFVERIDVAPRLTTALDWKDFHLVPYVSVRGTDYGSSFAPGNTTEVTGDNLYRSSFEFGADLKMPSLARVYDVKGFFGPKLKHVIEPRASYRRVTGVTDFHRIIRFDEVDLLTDTNQVEVGVTNRFYRKAKDGAVSEVFSWDLLQQRYFDPTFGGAVVAGQRTMIQTSAEITGFTFFDRPRDYSPVISTLRFNPIWTFGVEWTTMYDPLQKRFLGSTIQANTRVKKVNMWLGHNQVRLPWVKANQLQGMVGIGQENRHGWSAAFAANYDYRVGTLQYATTQVTYNSDCCGFSGQWRRFNFGTRQENQFRIAFAVANIGSFGTLKRQERIF